MSMKIPSHFDISADMDVAMSGFPSHFGLGIDQLPKINVGLDPVDLTLHPIEIKLDPLTLDLGAIAINPIDISLSLKQIPSVRMHFPADYKLCFAVFGRELMSFNFCGQGQVITEPYAPNPCECPDGFRGQASIVGAELENTVLAQA